MWSIIKFFLNLFPSPPKKRVRSNYFYVARQYWSDEEWDSYRDKVLGKRIP